MNRARPRVVAAIVVLVVIASCGSSDTSPSADELRHQVCKFQAERHAVLAEQVQIAERAAELNPGLKEWVEAIRALQRSDGNDEFPSRRQAKIFANVCRPELE